MIVLYAIAIYLAIGFLSAIAFVTIGVGRVTDYSMTVGARILLLPGATLLWPYILGRWMKSSRTP
jgi:hypothetical protein